VSGWLNKLFDKLSGMPPPIRLELPSHEDWYNSIWSAVAAGKYPEWADVEWFACDQLGQIAFLTTGGQGAVPRAVFRSLSDYLGVREAFWNLPRRCGHTLYQPESEKPRPDDWVKLAQQGLFGYDWSAANGPNVLEPGYRLVTSPECPLGLADLPEPTAAWVKCVTWDAVIFGQGGALLPERDFAEIVWWPGRTNG
jgi:hypothetical protein